jgi:hypothetical protein
MGAYAIAVVSLATAEEALRRGRIAARRDGDRLIASFPDALGIGAWVFAEIRR